MSIKLIKGQPTEVGMSGVMSDKDYYTMMASPLCSQTKIGVSLAKKVFTKIFGEELAKVYCK